MLSIDDFLIRLDSDVLNTKLCVSTGKNRFAKHCNERVISFEKLARTLYKVKRTDETVAEFTKMARVKRDDVKDVGWFVVGRFADKRRSGQTLLSRGALALDLDHAGEDWQSEIAFGWLGAFAYLVYSTHSHREDRPRLRLIVPLSREVTPDEYTAISRKVAEKVGIDNFDDTTHQAARVMYFPSCPSDGDFVFDINGGGVLDADVVLSMYQDWTDVFEWPLSSRERGKVEKGALRLHGKKQEDPLNKEGIVGAFCRTYSILDAIDTFLPGAYTEGSNADRLSYVGGSTSNGAVIYDDRWLYSHHESDPCGSRLVNAFDLVRLHLFADADTDASDRTPANRLPSYIKMRDFALADDAVKATLTREQMKDLDGLAGDVADVKDTGKRALLAEDDNGKRKAAATGAQVTPESITGAPDKAWLDNMVKELVLDKSGNITPRLTNIKLIIEHDPRLAGAIRFNELSQTPVRVKRLPWADCADAANGEPWQDKDDLRLREYIEKHYNVEISAQRVFEAVGLVAHTHSYHPVREYLDGLNWDYVPRVDTLLHRYLGCEDNAYTRAVSRKFLCAAVARAYSPGIKFDSVLIIEGKQGLGKSSFFRALASDNWFTDSLMNFHGRDAIESLQGKWIVEIADLQAFSKSDVNNIKAFISRQQDEARMAYGRQKSILPRQCILVGTTNDLEYLQDETGNRRFWPVPCEDSKVDCEGLRAERNQLFAEAKALWELGEPLYLPADIENIASDEQEKRVRREGLEGIIEQWLSKPIRSDHYDRPCDGFFNDDTAADAADVGAGGGEVVMVERDRVCPVEIWIECLDGRAKDFDRKEAIRVNRIMRNMKGWKEVSLVRFGERYGRARGFIKETE